MCLSQHVVAFSRFIDTVHTVALLFVMESGERDHGVIPPTLEVHAVRLRCGIVRFDSGK